MSGALGQKNVMQEKRKLAEKIINGSRSALILNLRFLAQAVSRCAMKPYEGSFGTDGSVMWYDADYILRTYREHPNLVTNACLHSTLHCIYLHPFAVGEIDVILWDLACDIAVENTVRQLDLRCTRHGMSEKRGAELATLNEKISVMTAEKIYRYLQTLSDRQRVELQGLFTVDDHLPWYLRKEIPQRVSQLGESRQNAQKDGTPQQEQDSEEGTSGQTAFGGQGTSLADLQQQALSDAWKEVAERLENEMENFAQGIGTEAGSFLTNIKNVTREKYDYAKFLKQFAVMGEVMKVSDAEWDYIFYTYGLQLYGNMPLIEPLEYREEKRIREFAIVIDTSGSVQGEVVQSFLNKTYNVLSQPQNYFDKVNIAIIQCDAEVQHCAMLDTADAMKKYIDEMKIYGGGGTDFVPAFQFVDAMIADKTFRNLKGLIYFTDGQGEFPVKAPAYKTAFVFLEDNPFNNYDVPSWAIKLILQSEDLIKN